MSSKTVVGAVDYNIFLLDWDYTEQTNNPFPTDTIAAGDKSNYLFKTKFDFSNVNHLRYIMVAKKKTDISGANQFCIDVGGNNELSAGYGIAESVGSDYIDVSGYTGLQDIVLYTTGGDDWSYYRYLKVWVVIEV